METAEAVIAQADELRREGRGEEAIQKLWPLVKREPHRADAADLLARLLGMHGLLNHAIEVFRAALPANPDNVKLHAGLALALTNVGDAAGAVAEYREAIRLQPHNSAMHSALLQTIHYPSEITSREIFEEHRIWAARHADPLTVAAPPHVNDRSPDRPLRIGFLSADFRDHPVARIVEPILASHDRAQFPVTCYCTAPGGGDAITQRLRSLASGWHDAAGMSDDDLAATIRRDRIDILIDFAGHTARNRLLLLARKPAPIQATHFGYPDTTGMAAMDYRITDPFADPPGQTEQSSTEQLARMPRVAYPWRPPDDLPPVASTLPAQINDHITFGCVNNLAKLSTATLAAWKRVLDAVPGSKLLIISTAGDAVYAIQLLAKGSIAADRIISVPRAEGLDYWRLFERIDIGLDPFPYNGGVTTTDTLWMGVPVVTLAGQTYVARQGVSLLSAVDLPQLIAPDVDSYVDCAAGLARDLPRLAELRRTLRDRMAGSPICDEARFTRELEVFYRRAWQRYCTS
jgi:predicted O-linked N-acetylglucosamine transferase (SPINDLY family)